MCDRWDIGGLSTGIHFQTDASCVQSPKCGNLNEMLDKEGALTLLRRMVAAAPSGN